MLKANGTKAELDSFVIKINGTTTPSVGAVEKFLKDRGATKEVMDKFYATVNKAAREEIKKVPLVDGQNFDLSNPKTDIATPLGKASDIARKTNLKPEQTNEMIKIALESSANKDGFITKESLKDAKIFDDDQSKHLLTAAKATNIASVEAAPAAVPSVNLDSAQQFAMLLQKQEADRKAEKEAAERKEQLKAEKEAADKKAAEEEKNKPMALIGRILSGDLSALVTLFSKIKDSNFMQALAQGFNDAIDGVKSAWAYVSNGFESKEKPETKVAENSKTKAPAPTSDGLPPLPEVTPPTLAAQVAAVKPANSR